MGDEKKKINFNSLPKISKCIFSFLSFRWQSRSASTAAAAAFKTLKFFPASNFSPVSPDGRFVRRADVRRRQSFLSADVAAPIINATLPLLMHPRGAGRLCQKRRVIAGKEV